MEQLLPDVYRLDGNSSNFYLCVEPEGLTLIDSGMPNREKLVWEAMAKIGRSPTDLKHILITHADIDHAGSAAAIQAASGATVYAGAETAELLQRGKSPKHMPWFAQFILDHFWGYQAVSQVTVCQPGQMLPVWGGLQVVAAAGHTLDQVAFYSPGRGILFAGDALNTRQNRLQVTPNGITADIPAARRTALHLLNLSAKIIACGHGNPLFTETQPGVSALLAQLQKGP